MTDIEIVNRVLKAMTPEGHSRFYDTCNNVSGATLRQIMKRVNGDRILKLMLKKKLIAIVRPDGNETIVKLTKKGYLVRESGGITFDQQKFWGIFQAGFWVWVGRLAALSALIWFILYLIDRD